MASIRLLTDDFHFLLASRLHIAIVEMDFAQPDSRMLSVDPPLVSPSTHPQAHVLASPLSDNRYLPTDISRKTESALLIFVVDVFLG